MTSSRVIVRVLKGLFPATVGAFLVAIVLHLAADGALHLVAAGAAAVYLLWVVLEVRITFRQPSEPSAEGKTLLPYALARVGTGTSAVLGPLPWDGLSWWMAAPAALFLGGVVWRLTAIRYLGRFYTHHVVRYSDHQVVTSGPYRIARHPAYTGMLVSHWGFVAFFANPVSVACCLLLTGTVVWRILVEERVLWTVPGYVDYATGRARLIPGVW